MQTEIWKKIQDYLNYEISSYGNVRVVATKEPIESKKNNRGYRKIQLQKEHGPTSLLIYKLVCQAFDVNYKKSSIIIHKNKYNFDDNINNLEIKLSQKFDF